MFFTIMVGGLVFLFLTGLLVLPSSYLTTVDENIRPFSSPTTQGIALGATLGLFGVLLSWALSAEEKRSERTRMAVAGWSAAWLIGIAVLLLVLVTGIATD